MGRVRRATAGCDAVTKDLARLLAQGVSGLVLPSTLNSLQYFQQQWRRNIRCGEAADPRKQVVFEKSQPLAAAGFAPFLRIDGVQFSSYLFECCGWVDTRGCLIQLTLLGQVRALS